MNKLTTAVKLPEPPAAPHNPQADSRIAAYQTTKSTNLLADAICQEP